MPMNGEVTPANFSVNFAPPKAEPNPSKPVGGRDPRSGHFKHLIGHSVDSGLPLSLAFSRVYRMNWKARTELGKLCSIP
jgi:hypothetical protein